MWIISERSYSQVIASLRWRRARGTAGRASCGYRCDSCRILNRLLVLSGANIPKHCRSRAKKYGEVRSIQVATKFIQFPVPLAFFSLTKGMPFLFFFFSNNKLNSFLDSVESSIFLHPLDPPSPQETDVSRKVSTKRIENKRNKARS